jgi:hypothetical protein
MNKPSTWIGMFLLWNFIIHGNLGAQSPTWTLWASGLPSGVYPRMAVAPNHDIFYTLLGAGINLGYIYKANTQDASGHFTSLPKIPRPATIQNNIVALGYNQWSEPLAGIYRSEITDPWLFRFDLATQTWDTAVSPINPSLGGHCMATSANGTIYVGTRWAYIYKSTDDGRTFQIIDDTHAVESEYPCYYPTFNGSAYNGAIFSIQIDNNGRVYAGTETAGVIYSDDEGEHWQPADFFACLPGDSTLKDSNSAMIPLTKSGNVAGLGFTKDNQLVWTGVIMWAFGWKNEMGFADLDAHTVSPVEGLPDYLIQVGQQVSRIVTTDNGQMFFHSGTSNGATEIGIYTSWDGIHWSLFNDGITGQNDGQSQGSLAVDGNKVFMATHDGQVWMYEDTTLINGIKDIHQEYSVVTIFPNPASSYIELKLSKAVASRVDEIQIFNFLGQPVLSLSDFGEILPSLNISGLWPGMYYLQVLEKRNAIGCVRFVKVRE